MSPDTLSTALNEVERSQTDLTYPLADTLKATVRPSNILVIDSAERINNELASQVKRLIEMVVSDNSPSQSIVWQILIIGQTEAWNDGRLQSLLGEKQSASVGIGLFLLRMFV